MKRFLMIVLLLIPTVTNLTAQCWLDEQYREVTAYKGQVITLGAVPKNPGEVGRTVCYKWTDTQYKIAGAPLDQPTLTIQAPQQPGEYFFYVKRIGDHVQTCSIKLTVENSVIIESVEPKEGCIKKPLRGCPNVNDFDIVTSPRGYEDYVEVVGCEKISDDVETPNDEDWTVSFALIKEGETLDTKTIQVTYYLDFSAGINIDLDECEISFSGNYGILSVETPGIDAQLVCNSFNMLKQSSNKVLEGCIELLKMTPGLQVVPMKSCASPKINGSIGLEISRTCCKGKRGVGLDIDLQNLGINYRCGAEIGLGLPKIRIGGMIGFDIFAGTTEHLNFSCDTDNKYLEFGIGGRIGLFGGLYAEAISDKLLRGEAYIQGNVDINAFRLLIARDATISIRSLEICADVYAVASVKLLSYVKLSSPKIALMKQRCWPIIHIN